MRTFLSRFGMSGRLFIVATALAFAVAAPVAAQTAATGFSGHATGVIALVNNPLGGDPLVDARLVEAGPLPVEGGSDSDDAFEASIEGLLTADVISAQTEGSGNRAESSAEIVGLEASILELLDIESSTLASNAVARCGRNGATVRGSSVVEELFLNDDRIAITGEPNQTVEDLPDGITVIINEQVSDVEGDGSFGAITVNALHVIIDDPTDGTLADVIFAQSHADVTCLPDSSTDGTIPTAGTDTPAGPIMFMLVLFGGLGVTMLLFRPLLVSRR